MDEEDDTILP